MIAIKRVFVAFGILLAAGAGPARGLAQSPAPPPVSAPQFRITDREVVAVQVELIQRGYLKGRPSGQFDANTRAALQRYQSESRLPVTGRIDAATYRSLGLPYPATGREAESLGGKKGFGSAMGTGVKGAASVAGNTAQAVGSGVRTGAEKTAAAGGAVASKSKDLASDAGRATMTGARKAGQTTSRAGSTLISRQSDEVYVEVKETLTRNPATRDWKFNVQQGKVSITVPRRHNADVGAVVADIRKIAGVKSVFVIAQ